MPTYDYECRGCRHRLEVMQGINEDPLKTCPSCGQDDLRRLIGGGGALIFKGTGFYCTDYPKPAAQPKKTSD